jgi:hypothetical protein
MQPMPETRPLAPLPQPLVHALEPWQLRSWSPYQQHCIYSVFSLIDGRLTVDEIKAQVPLPPTIVDEVLRILLQIRAIIL